MELEKIILKAEKERANKKKKKQNVNVKLRLCEYMKEQLRTSCHTRGWSPKQRALIVLPYPRRRYTIHTNSFVLFSYKLITAWHDRTVRPKDRDRTVVFVNRWLSYKTQHRQEELHNITDAEQLKHEIKNELLEQARKKNARLGVTQWWYLRVHAAVETCWASKSP